MGEERSGRGGLGPPTLASAYNRVFPEGSVLLGGGR